MAHVAGTLNGTSQSASTPPVGLSLLQLRGGVAPFAPPTSAVIVNPPSGLITFAAAAPTVKVTAKPPAGLISFLADAPTGIIKSFPSAGLITWSADGPTPVFSPQTVAVTVIETVAGTGGGGGGVFQPAPIRVFGDDEVVAALAAAGIIARPRIRVSTTGRRIFPGRD